MHAHVVCDALTAVSEVTEASPCSSGTEARLPRPHATPFFGLLPQSRGRAQVSPRRETPGDLTPSGVWSQKIGSDSVSCAAPDVSCRFGESLGLLGECRHHLAQLSVELRDKRVSEVTIPPSRFLDLVTNLKEVALPFL